MAAYKTFAKGMFAGALLNHFINPKPDTISHSVQLFYNIKPSPQEWIDRIKEIIASRGIPMDVRDVDGRAISISAARQRNARRYLEVKRGRYTYTICAARFGNTFFFSYWLKEKYDLVSRIVRVIPIIGGPMFRLLNPVSYFHADSSAVFLRVVTDALEIASKELIATHGVRHEYAENQAVHKSFTDTTQS